jgi:transposase
MISLPQHIIVAAKPVGSVEKKRKAVGNSERSVSIIHGFPPLLSRRNISRSYQVGATNIIPWAEVTFDEFHIFRMANVVINEVRCGEELKTEHTLIGIRWCYFKDASYWKQNQINQIYTLSRMCLKTTKAWQLKESLRKIFQNASSPEEAEPLQNKWYSWARCCRVPQMKDFALTIKRHWNGVLNCFYSKLANCSGGTL